MSGAVWKRAKEIFHEALELKAQERTRFLESACEEDPGLRARVEQLLAAHDDAGDFLDSPTVGEADGVAPTVATLTGLSPTERPGATIGKYKLLQVIGEGGFGVVYMAEQQEPLRRRVALKIIKLGMDTRQVIARFEAERQALALMEHPNIAQVFDAGATATGRPFFVMELVRGVPITEYCDANRLSTRERLDLFIDVCSAVQHAHQKGIIHRDIKPSNVMVTLHDGKPVPKVIDFGIAKATHARLTEKTLFTEYGQFIGTPVYMSPEQAEISGLDVDTRSDIYSLGVLLYELLTGTTPFDSETLRGAGYAEMQRIIREDEPPRPSTRLSTAGDALTEIAKHRKIDPRGLTRLIRGDLDWIVMKTLEKDRSRRYEAPMELVAELRRYLAHEPVAAGPPSATYRTRKFLRRHSIAVTVAGVVLAALVTGLAAATFGLAQARRANERAEREATTAGQVSDFLVGLFEVSDPGEARGSTITARELLDSAVDDIDNELTDEPRVRARMLSTMGSVYLNLGLLDDASRLLGEALSVEQEIGAEAGSRTPERLAWVQLRLGRYAEAEQLYRATLEERKERLGEQHPDTAMIMHSLGNVQRIQGQTDEAETLLVGAIEILERTLGREHRLTLAAIGDLSALFSKQGRHAKAVGLLEECVEGFRKARGPDHFKTLVAQRQLASANASLGRFDEAERLFLDTIATQQRVVGMDHPDLLETNYNLGRLYQKQGRHSEALPVFLENLEGVRRVRGEDHPHYIRDMKAVGDTHKALGQYDEAAAIGVELLEKQRKLLGPEHWNTLLTMNALGFVYRLGGRYDEAEQVLTETIELEKRAFPDKQILGTNNLGLVYMDQDRYEEAESLFVRSIENKTRARGRDHPDTQVPMTNLAKLYIAMGDEDRARPLLREVLTARRKAAAGPAATPSTKHAIARALLTIEPTDLRDPSAALELAMEANERTDFSNPGFLDTLSLAYHLTGDSAKAIENQKRAISLVSEEDLRLRARLSRALEEFESGTDGD